MKKFFLFLLVIAFAFSSCKKDKEDDNCSLSDANLAGTYKITSVRYKLSASSPEVNFFDLFPQEDCEKDDLTVFNANHSVAYTDAGIACSPSNSDTGTWALNGSVLTIDAQSGTLEGFTCAGFNLIGTDVDTPGDRITVTYTKQ